MYSKYTLKHNSTGTLLFIPHNSSSPAVRLFFSRPKNASKRQHFFVVHQVGKVSVNNGQALLVVNERGDWLSVVPIVVPVDVALRHLADMWDRFSRDLGDYARLGKRTAEGETLPEHDPRNDAKIFDSVVSTARVGPITGGTGTANEMWALRRQGDMLYLVSERWRWCGLSVCHLS